MSKKKDRPSPDSLGLPRVGIESHAHLDVESMRGDLDDILARAASAGLAAIGNVFLGPDAYEEHRGLFDGRSEVFFILGLHPHDSDIMTDEIMARMESAFRADRRLKGLGETGLDYHYLHASPAERQQDAFRRQLALARDLDMPAVIHSREAAEDTIKILEDMGFRDRPVLWHCYGGGPDLAAVIAAHGWHLSIPGPVTYSRNTDLMDAVRTIPQDRLLIETDCPYLSPEPYRGRRNEPAFIAFTARKIAELRGVSTEEIWALTADNARRFFGL